jgi:hypothetical protein
MASRPESTRLDPAPDPKATGWTASTRSTAAGVKISRGGRLEKVSRNPTFLLQPTQPPAGNLDRGRQDSSRELHLFTGWGSDAGAPPL